ncbi:hypothetical protein [Dipodfec virus UOA04_Rod_707]|nr:hypothetical protein [Dipodfec virus UOA04_Rod_707]
MHIITKKYLWKTKDDKFCMKIITDLEETHSEFVEILKHNDAVIKCTVEYLGEIDCEKLNLIDVVFDNEDTFEEQIAPPLQEV